MSHGIPQGDAPAQDESDDLRDEALDREVSAIATLFGSGGCNRMTPPRPGGGPRHQS